MFHFYLKFSSKHIKNNQKTQSSITSPIITSLEVHSVHSLNSTHFTRKARSFRFVFASFKLLDSLLINHTNAHYYHPLTQEAIHTPYTNYHCPSPSYHSLTHSLTRKLARSLVRSFILITLKHSPGIK